MKPWRSISRPPHGCMKPTTSLFGFSVRPRRRDNASACTTAAADGDPTAARFRSLRPGLARRPLVRRGPLPSSARPALVPPRPHRSQRSVADQLWTPASIRCPGLARPVDCQPAARPCHRSLAGDGSGERQARVLRVDRRVRTRGAGVPLHAQADDLDWFARELARLPFDSRCANPPRCERPCESAARACNAWRRPEIPLQARR